MISKQFHYQLRNSEKQAFVGPPDNMREHVLAAAKALKAWFISTHCFVIKIKGETFYELHFPANSVLLEIQ